MRNDYDVVYSSYGDSMSDSSTKNAALTTALAFHYQVLIGLDKCFDLNEGQSIWFEKDGDVSLTASDNSCSEQLEVKNYKSPLTDHHENFWKTLKNWLAPEFDDTDYGSLVLHTTQAFGSNSRFKSWNKQSSDERLKTLTSIFAERDDDELKSENLSGVAKIQKAVMEESPERLKEVLSKITLFTEADDLLLLEKKIYSKPVGIPASNLKSFLEGLIGFVYSKADNSSWHIPENEFRAKCEELTSQYCKKEFTFPKFEGSEATDEQVELHKSKLFVEKIAAIEHYAMIPDALGNWLELQNSLMEQLDEFPLYLEKTTNYQNQLVKRYKIQYSSAQLEATDSLKGSKILYNKTMLETPLHIGNDIPPIEYKNGLIHDAMDDEERDLH